MRHILSICHNCPFPIVSPWVVALVFITDVTLGGIWTRVTISQVTVPEDRIQLNLGQMHTSGSKHSGDSRVGFSEVNVGVQGTSSSRSVGNNGFSGKGL